jgi:hypothetical protein
MTRSPIPALAAALTAAALLTGAMAVPASASPLGVGYTGYGYGAGTTAQAAENAAVIYLGDHNFNCFAPIHLVSDALQSDGYWDAVVSEHCIVDNN